MTRSFLLVFMALMEVVELRNTALWSYLDREERFTDFLVMSQER